MPRSDRLRTLAACHGVLRFNRLETLDAYRAATPEQLAGLHTYRHEIRRLVAAGNPDVLAALFPANPRVTWSVARLTYDPHARLLSAIRGQVGEQHDELLSLTYDVRDADDERRAWRALVGVLQSA